MKPDQLDGRTPDEVANVAALLMGADGTDGDDHKKKVIMHPLVNPKFSILDPEYTYSVPEYHAMTT